METIMDTAIRIIKEPKGEMDIPTKQATDNNPFHFLL